MPSARPQAEDPTRQAAVARPRLDSPLAGALAALAAAAREAGLTASGSGAPDPETGGAPAAEVLAERPDGVVVRVGAVVAKAHAPGSDTAALGARLAVARHPALRDVLLAPYPGTAQARGRVATLWPYGSPVDPGDPAAAPWEAAGALLARLHVLEPAALPGPLPPMRGPAKAARAVARLDRVPGSATVRTVRRAWARLPAWARDEAPYRGPAALCHGDLHLGQLVRHPAPAGAWRLIDVDDLGLGDPAWDLARPAMWFAVGLLEPAAWARFLAAYLRAGGPAVPADGDPWPRLDVPARALAVQTAAIAVAKAARDGREPDEAESLVLAACARAAGPTGHPH